MTLVRDAVRVIFLPFSARYEGVFYNFYADIKNLITTGVGNLADPLAAALALPMRCPDGGIASPEQITRDWQIVKTDPDAARKGARYAATITALRLSPDDLVALVDSKMESFAASLTKRWPAFPSWPADAQLAILSWSWAVGTGAAFPQLAAALAAGDFAAAAGEVAINAQGNPGVVPRNEINKQLLLAAASAADPDQLSIAVPTSPLPPVPPPGYDPGPSPSGGGGGDSGGPGDDAPPGSGWTAGGVALASAGALALGFVGWKVAASVMEGGGALGRLANPSGPRPSCHTAQAPRGRSRVEILGDRITVFLAGRPAMPLRPSLWIAVDQGGDVWGKCSVALAPQGAAQSGEIEAPVSGHISGDRVPGTPTRVAVAKARGELIGRVTRIWYTRHDRPLGMDHPFKGKALLYRAGRGFRLELPPGCVVNSLGFVNP